MASQGIHIRTACPGWPAAGVLCDKPSLELYMEALPPCPGDSSLTQLCALINKLYRRKGKEFCMADRHVGIGLWWLVREMYAF